MSVDQYSGASLSVRDYLSVLRRRRRLIAVCLLAGLALAVGYAGLAPRKWTSTAQVVVRPVNQSLTEASSVGPDKLLTMSTEQQVASSGDVALAARRILRSTDTAEELLQHVSVSNPAGTVVLVFQFTASSAESAQAGAEAFARAYLAQRRSRYAQQVRHETALIDQQLAALSKQSGSSGQRAALVQQRSALLTLDTTPGSFNQNATLPIAPSSPNRKLGLAIGGFLGLFIGILAAFARDATDPRLRDGGDLADRLGRPTLTELPPVWRAGARSRPGMVLTDAPTSKQAAALRLLRSRLQLAGLGEDHRVLLVTSPRRVGGKSLVAANVAAGLAEVGRSVLLVSADRSAPSHQALFGVTAASPARPGRGNGTPAIAPPVQVRVPQWDGELRLAAADAGRSAPGWPESIADAGSVDVVVIDCPALLEDPDALTAVQRADLVLVVADPATRRPDLSRIDQLLDEAGATVLGGVFDRSRTRPDGSVEPPAPGPALRPVHSSRPRVPQTPWTPTGSADAMASKQVGTRSK